MARNERPAETRRWYVVVSEWHPEWGTRRVHVGGAAEAAQALDTCGPVTVLVETTGETLRFNEVRHG